MSGYYIAKRTNHQWVAFDAYHPEIASYGKTKNKAISGLPGFRLMTETSIEDMKVRNTQLTEYQIESRKSWQSIMSRYYALMG